jgi:hypothetical protein
LMTSEKGDNAPFSETFPDLLMLSLWRNKSVRIKLSLLWVILWSEVLEKLLVSQLAKNFLVLYVPRVHESPPVDQFWVTWSHSDALLTFTFVYFLTI